MKGTAKEIERKLDKVLENVNKAINVTAKSGEMYADPMSSEGYAGGYKKAISDVIQLLNGIHPKTRNYWD